MITNNERLIKYNVNELIDNILNTSINKFTKQSLTEKSNSDLIVKTLLLKTNKSDDCIRLLKTFINGVFNDDVKSFQKWFTQYIILYKSNPIILNDMYTYWISFLIKYYRKINIKVYINYKFLVHILILFKSNVCLIWLMKIIKHKLTHDCININSVILSLCSLNETALNILLNTQNMKTKINNEIIKHILFTIITSEDINYIEKSLDLFIKHFSFVNNKEIKEIIKEIVNTFNYNISVDNKESEPLMILLDKFDMSE